MLMLSMQFLWANRFPKTRKVHRAQLRNAQTGVGGGRFVVSPGRPAGGLCDVLTPPATTDLPIKSELNYHFPENVTIWRQ